MATHGKGHVTNGAAPPSARPPAGVAPGGLDLPAEADILRECQAMSLATVREVFESRHDLSKRQARGAGMVFRGVGTTLRTIEVGQRE